MQIVLTYISKSPAFFLWEKVLLFFLNLSQEEKSINNNFYRSLFKYGWFRVTGLPQEATLGNLVTSMLVMLLPLWPFENKNMTIKSRFQQGPDKSGRGSDYSCKIRVNCKYWGHLNWFLLKLYIYLTIPIFAVISHNSVLKFVTRNYV